MAALCPDIVPRGVRGGWAAYAIDHCSPATYHPLATTHCLPPTAYFLPPITRYGWIGGRCCSHLAQMSRVALTLILNPSPSPSPSHNPSPHQVDRQALLLAPSTMARLMIMSEFFCEARKRLEVAVC